jgi:hypothetical protein
MSSAVVMGAAGGDVPGAREACEHAGEDAQDVLLAADGRGGPKPAQKRRTKEYRSR